MTLHGTNEAVAGFAGLQTHDDDRLTSDASGHEASSSDDTPSEHPASLIDRLLGEQQQLTAVDRFSRAYDNDVPAQARYYSRLLPASAPGAGQQYGFEVDLDRCSGCKACVTACHSLNGLDENETWRDVGLLIGGTSTAPVMQHVTTACHHCVEPACAIACPVDAYEKHPDTGIVKHLDDQCFGCQYCTLACPYDVPKYHHEKGIVRKCDMCSDRLAAGESPACVQACPHEAIAIRIVDTEQVIEDSEASHFLPAAPDPAMTLPTTTYRTSRVLPRNMLPADYRSVHSQHPHWPLIIMLVLTQLSVGAFAVGMTLDRFVSDTLMAAMRPLHATSALLFGLLALAASTFHLGRPQYAFRAIIGLRHSWLSREILAFGVFAGLACVYAAMAWLPGVSPILLHAAGWSVVAFGMVGVACSIMIYVFTQRVFWSITSTGPRFVLTSAMLGIAAAWLTLLMLGVAAGNQAANQLADQCGRRLCQTLVIVTLAKLTFEAAGFRHLASRSTTSLKRSAILMSGQLSNHTLARFASGLLGGIVMPGFLLAQHGQPIAGIVDLIVVSLLFVACLAGELLERFLFFAAVSSPRMPGGVRT